MNAFHGMGIDRLRLVCSHAFLFKRNHAYPLDCIHFELALF
nr:MAG TPA: hypothetical protein [Caudoviricetes sp.]